MSVLISLTGLILSIAAIVAFFQIAGDVRVIRRLLENTEKRRAETDEVAAESARREALRARSRALNGPPVK